MPPAATSFPWLGLTAVLLGTFISTLNTRLSALGLADIRGAVHASFDEGAWITTAQTVAQMLVTLVAIWLGAIYGTRKALMEAAAAFALISFLEPFSPNLQTLLVLQFLGGLTSGFFIPLTLSFVLRNTPPNAWAYGIAIYALNLEVSLNISASLEGWYTDHLSWQWIFWQNVPLALGMVACLYFGIRPEQPAATPPRADVFGCLFGGFGPSDAMPMSIADAERLIQLGDDKRQALFRHSHDVHLDVQHVAAAHFRNDPAGHHVQVLKALDDARQRAEICFSDDAHAQERGGLG
jgi:DHA2 family multidrug resistance protein